MPQRKLRLSILVWLTILTFTSGYTDSISIIYLQIPTTHHSGNIVNSILSLLNESYDVAINFALAIIFFFLGSMVAGIFFYKKHVGFSNMFAILNIIYAIFYIILNLLLKNNLILIISTAFMSGLQNALLTRYKGITTRTTHMTGYITDAAVNLGRALLGDKTSLKTGIFYLINIFIFFSGAVVGIYIIRVLNYYSFIIAAILKILSSIFYIIFINKKDKHQIILKNG